MKKRYLPQILLLLTTMLIFSVNAFSQSCPSGMISYWRLQEAKGPTYADEMGNHTAVTSTAPTQTAGISGKAQLFNSSGKTFVSVPDHSDFDWAGTASFTIELWTRYSGSGAVQVFIGRDDPTTDTQWWIGMTTTGKVEWFMRASDGSNGDVTTAISYNNGQWHHVVAVRDASQGKNILYIDNVAINTSVTYGGSFASTAGLNIGYLKNNSDPPAYFLDGSLDEMAIYNRALDPAEVTAHYNNVRLYQIGYCDGDNPAFLSDPNIYATVGQPYTYDVDASGNSTPIYSLVEKPSTMNIDQVTGVITWTPASATENGHVVVRATNNKGYVEQTFNIFIAEAPDCRNNLIAYWDFNSTNGAPYFDNIANYALTGSAPVSVSGIVGNALMFDGVNDSLNMQDPEAGSNIFFDFDDVPSFSIEAWIKTDATPTEVMVITGRDEDGNNTHYWIGVETDGKVSFMLRDYLATPNEAIITGGSVLDNAWHHIVGTYNASTNSMKLYVDKILVDETTQNFTNFGGNDNLNVGCLNKLDGASRFWFNGIIDELAFYNTDLPEARVISNYNAAMAGNGACTYNYAPVIVSSPDTTVEQGSPYYYQLVCTDINPSDVISITAPVKPGFMNLTYVPTDTVATLSFVPTNNNVGTHDVTLRVSDGSINVDQVFKIRVINVNDPPTITSTPVTAVDEDHVYTYTVVGNDIDGDTLTYTAPQKPLWLNFDPDTHILSGTPANDDVGTADVTVSVSDGTVSVDQPFQIIVSNTNDLPVITSDPDTGAVVGQAYLYEITATDVDEGDNLTFSYTTKPEWLTFTAGANSGVLSGTPSVNDIGSHSVILSVSDGHGSVLQGFTIKVSQPSAVNDANTLLNSIYPVPASDKVYFRFNEPGSSIIILYDMAGNKVREIDSRNSNLVEVNISDLSAGIYTYRVIQNNKIGFGKMTKR